MNQWAILDVLTFKERHGEFIFKCQRPFRSKVVFFPESGMILINEIGDFNIKKGRFTFMPYPSLPPGNNEERFWQIDIEDIFNNLTIPLNFRNRVAVYLNKVDDKIKWTVYDFEQKTITPHEVNKPEGGEYSLRYVNELKEGVYLLIIDAPKPEFLSMVYV
jgi:hypothetical protein